MPATVEPLTHSARPVDVEVFDFLGQDSIEFGQMESSTPAGDLLGLSRSRLQALPNVDYTLRDTESSRLLRSDQPIGDVARQGKVSLRLQPDARLG